MRLQKANCGNIAERLGAHIVVYVDTSWASIYQPEHMVEPTVSESQRQTGGSLGPQSCVACALRIGMNLTFV